MGLLAAFTHRDYSIVIDCILLSLLGISDDHVGGALIRSMPLKHLTIILSLITRMRGVVTWVRRRMRPTRHGRPARATLHGGPGHILLVLGSLLMMRVHPQRNGQEGYEDPRIYELLV
jgi:hypothetical protein